jgi:hypothetical protein
VCSYRRKFSDLQRRAQSIRPSDRSLSAGRILSTHCERTGLHGDGIDAGRKRTRHFPRPPLCAQLDRPIVIRAITPKSARIPVCVTWRKSDESPALMAFLEILRELKPAIRKQMEEHSGKKSDQYAFATNRNL